MKRPFVTFLFTVVAAAALCAQDEPPTPQPPAGGAGGGGRGGFGGGAAQNPDPQPYDRVITKEAKTTKGLFTIHQIKERYFYEIPKSAFGKEFLWNTQIAKPRSARVTEADSLTTRSSGGTSRVTACCSSKSPTV